MNLTYSLKSRLRADKKKADGTCPIYLFLRVGKVVSKIPSGKSISPEQWDNKNQCPKTGTKHGRLLDHYLRNEIIEFENYMLEQTLNGTPITLMTATSFFDENNEVTFYGFWEEQVGLWEHKYSHNTIKSYKSVLRLLKEFSPKANFGDINVTFIERFDKYLSDKRHNTLNGRFVKHRCCRAILYMAIRKGFIKENPYKYFPIKTSEVHRKFLSIDEVTHVINMDLSGYPPILSIVRDMFLFGCFTALRISDVMSLRVENIKLGDGVATLELKIIKTERLLRIPLLDMALDIVKKYALTLGKDKNQLIFPRIANQTVNRMLKDLMGVAKIDKHISFHCARHTCASNLLEAGVPIEQVKEILGHRRLAETEIYAKVMFNDLRKSTSALNESYKQK